MSDWNFAAVWDGIAAIVPDRDALVCGDRRITWAGFRIAPTRLARHLQSSADVGPGDRVAIDLTNRPEYLETFYAALLLGAVPVNVNFRYTASELRYLLDNSDAKAIVHGPEFAVPVEAAVRQLEPARPPARLEAGGAYEQALAASPAGEWSPRPASGDDLIFLYTGGTTGMPKGVMWRNDDLYVALWVSAHPRRPGSTRPLGGGAGREAGGHAPARGAADARHGAVRIAVGAGRWGHHRPRRPPGARPRGDLGHRGARPRRGAHHRRRRLRAVRCSTCSTRIPDRWDLTALRAITSSGVLFSPAVKRGLLGHLPALTIVDSLGASEGLGPRNAARAGDETIAPARFSVNDRIRVVDEDTGRDVTPGSDEVGLVAMGGRIPLGYFKDPEKSATTFRVFDGVRYSVPGDYATVDVDGTVRLLGRGSACINTGGEKVYPEEVEAELRRHPGVFDCVVVGVPRRALRRAGRRAGAGEPTATPSTRPSWPRGAVTGWPGTRCRAASSSSTRSARSAAGKAHHRELQASGGAVARRRGRLRPGAGAARQAPRASGADQLSTGGAAMTGPRPESSPTRSRPVRLAS